MQGTQSSNPIPSRKMSPPSKGDDDDDGEDDDDDHDSGGHHDGYYDGFNREGADGDACSDPSDKDNAVKNHNTGGHMSIITNL